MSPPFNYIEGVLPAPHLLDKLWDALPWENREGAPRYECWMNDYGMPYTYGTGDHARTYQALPKWEDRVRMICAFLNVTMEAQFDCCFVNGYAHGRQHLGWHADDSPEMDHEHPIAVVSFGAAREIWFRRKPPTNGDAYIDHVHKQMLANGSVLVMEAGMQRNWQHRIPKSPDANCGRRISLTFRKLVR